MDANEMVKKVKRQCVRAVLRHRLEGGPAKAYAKLAMGNGPRKGRP
jgi:hypothetical protein